MKFVWAGSRILHKIWDRQFHHIQSLHSETSILLYRSSVSTNTSPWLKQVTAICNGVPLIKTQFPTKGRNAFWLGRIRTLSFLRSLPRWWCWNVDNDDDWRYDESQEPFCFPKHSAISRLYATSHNLFPVNPFDDSQHPTTDKNKRKYSKFGIKLRILYFHTSHCTLFPSSSI